MSAKSPTSLHPEARLPEEWQAVVQELGEAPFRGRQVFRWLHARATRDPLAMTDLPRAFRERLPAAEFTAPLEVIDVKRSRDGTRKLVCELRRGGTIECVIIPMSDDPAEDPGEEGDADEDGGWDGRVTLCISTQIGCAMGCVFCASGQAGLERGLEPEEVVAQVAAAKLHLDPNEHLRNLVFMGMGEPLHHYDDTARAIRLLTHPDGLAISPRRITVSTVGLVPGIRRLGEDFAGKVGLALSLHAPNDVVRGRIMPMNKKYPFGEVLDALRKYPLPKRRRITIEYTLIDGVNDDVAHARELGRALTGLRVKVNLIPMNPIEASELAAPRASRVEAFREALSREGYGVSVRKTRGDDVDAACGQLVLKDRLLEKAREKAKGEGTLFRRVLVANRGEIAVRVMRTCKKLGIATVAVYSDADAGLPHVKMADLAVRIGPAPVRDSYLDVDAIVRAIRETSADAVHPGYGLLSENAQFAERVAATGATFIGPPVFALEAFGDKLRARKVARSVGVPPPPGSDTSIDPSDEAALASALSTIGLPLLVKAAGGGGGIGMQIVRDAGSLVKAARTCADRGKAAFGDPRIYVERYVDRPHHIEVQVFRDAHGTGLALGERECSVQRRHQKIIEESPSPAPFFDGDLGQVRREKLCIDALRVVEAAGYEGAGTVEFVFDGEGNGHFLEVNARLQVEHPVTEMVTGLDLVELQLRVAAREFLSTLVPSPRVDGHAIEARVYAEDPAKGFIPQPGKLERLEWPKGHAGVRIDSGVEQGSEVTPHYDPMIAKVIAHGASREEAIARLDGALSATTLELLGPKGPRATNIPFLRKVLRDQRFMSGNYDTALAEAVARGE